MKKSILILSGCLGILCLSLLAACSKDEEGTNPPDDGGGDNEEEVVISLSSDSVSVGSGAGRQTVELTSNTEWEIDNPNSLLSWCVISPVRGQAGTVTLTVEVSANESYDMREHTFNIVAGTETVSLTVSQTQFGYLDFRLASKGGNIFLDEGGICEVLATTSIEYEIEYTDNGGEWVSLLQTKTLEDETLLFRIAEYTGDSQRECDIVFKEVGGEKDTIHIVQYHDTEVEFEDAEFERYCLEHFDDDRDGRIIGREVRNIREMNVSELGLTSLSGIEAFENLEVLYCSDNELSSLDLRQNKKLKDLNCRNNPLISLDVSGFTSLQSLACHTTSLNASGCTSLQDLSFNTLSVVNINLSGCTNLKMDFLNGNSFMNGKLETLDVSDCPGVQNMIMFSKVPQLTSVDVSGCTNLQSLYTDGGNLTTLDVSGCTSLQTLNCRNHPLTTLDVSGCINLQNLIITDEGTIGTTVMCNLTSLDLSDCSALQTLNCRNNQLTDLDLSNCPALYELNCGGNRLTSLDLSNCPALYELYCFSTQLTSLDLSSCPDLYKLDCGNNQLTDLDLSSCPDLDDLYCDSNQLTTLDVSFCPDLSTLYCGDNPLQSMTILQEQEWEYWMKDIKSEYPGIEIIKK